MKKKFETAVAVAGVICILLPAKEINIRCGLVVENVLYQVDNSKCCLYGALSGTCYETLSFPEVYIVLGFITYAPR